MENKSQCWVTRMPSVCRSRRGRPIGFLGFSCTKPARTRLHFESPMTCPKLSLRANFSQVALRRWLPNRIFKCVMGLSGRPPPPSPVSHSFAFRGAATGSRCLGAPDVCVVALLSVHPTRLGRLRGDAVTGLAVQARKSEVNPTFRRLLG